LAFFNNICLQIPEPTTETALETVVVAPEPRLRHLEVALHRMERNHEGHRIFGANHYEPVVSVNQILDFYLVTGSGEGNLDVL